MERRALRDVAGGDPRRPASASRPTRSAAVALTPLSRSVAASCPFPCWPRPPSWWTGPALAMLLAPLVPRGEPPVLLVPLVTRGEPPGWPAPSRPATWQLAGGQRSVR